MFGLILQKNEFESVEYFCKNNKIEFSIYSFEDREIEFYNEKDREIVMNFLKRLRK